MFSRASILLFLTVSCAADSTVDRQRHQIASSTENGANPIRRVVTMLQGLAKKDYRRIREGEGAL
jgi:hypothetical protein